MMIDSKQFYIENTARRQRVRRGYYFDWFPNPELRAITYLHEMKITCLTINERNVENVDFYCIISRSVE